MLAIGGLTSFKTNPTDTLIQRSLLPFTIGYTTTRAIVGQAILTSYWFHDKIRIFGDFWYKNMPYHYWGIGYEAGLNTPKSDSTTAFQREWWWVNPRILYQFKKNYFVGTNINFNYTQGSGASNGVTTDATFQKYLDKPLNTGLG